MNSFKDQIFSNVSPKQQELLGRFIKQIDIQNARIEIMEENSTAKKGKVSGAKREVQISIEEDLSDANMLDTGVF